MDADLEVGDDAVAVACTSRRKGATCGANVFVFDTRARSRCFQSESQKPEKKETDPWVERLWPKMRLMLFSFSV